MGKNVVRIRFATKIFLHNPDNNADILKALGVHLAKKMSG